MKRRRFVQSSLAAGLAASPLATALAADARLEPTPRDYEGPYYPVGERNRTSDLVTGTPREPILNFSGQLVDSSGRPIGGALVDLWQADPLGHYKHPRDPSSGERWAEFLYWGEAWTDADGAFRFRTYLPGAYSRRPSHIHYKIWHEKQRLLTSQVYFRQTGGTRGASLNDDRADLQVVDLVEADDALACHLRIVI